MTFYMNIIFMCTNNGYSRIHQTLLCITYHVHSESADSRRVDIYLRTQNDNKTSYQFDVFIDATYLVLCGPVNVIRICLVLLEKSGMLIVDCSVVSRVSLNVLSSITVISKLTEC